MKSGLTMSILVIVTRGIDQNLQRTGRYIAFDEWINLVESDPSLRMRTAPYVAVNPATGDRIAMRAGEADSELEVRREWVPFLSYHEGKLTIRFADELLDPENPIRNKIGDVARALDALITHDAGEELLKW
jgi:hypothetical protein